MDEDARRSFYGWRIVAAAFLVQGLSTGATVYVYGVFLKPLAEEFGASRMASGLGLSAFFTVQALVSPGLGRALDVRSIRTLMLVGVALLCGGLALIAAGNALWQLGVVFAVLVGLGSVMTGPLAASTLVANWFTTQRGRALGLAALGTSFCGFFLPPIASLLIESIGWRAACLLLAAGVGAILLPVVAMVVVSRPEERGTTPDGAPAVVAHPGAPAPPEASARTSRSLLRDRDFWSITGGIGLLAASAVALLTHLVAFATDLGIEPQNAAWLLSVSAGFAMCGKLFFGSIADRVDLRVAFWSMVGVQLLGWMALLYGTDYGTLLFAAGILGLGTGGNLPMSGALVGATFGRADFGRVTGLMSPMMLALTLVTPPLAGYLFDRSGSYDLAFRILFGLTLFAALPISFLRVGARQPSVASPA